MTFIEVHPNENEIALEKAIQHAYTAMYKETAPSIRFGRIIIWQGRMFQQLELSPVSNAFQYEDKVFHTWTLPAGRGRIQVGSIRGAIFTTPAEAEGVLSARIKEGGRCAPEYNVTPFHYSYYENGA